MFEVLYKPFDSCDVFAVERFQEKTNKKKRVLVIRFSSLGDVLLTFPAVELLQNCEIHYLTKEAFRALVETHPGIYKVHTISNHASLKEYWLKLRALRLIGFDTVYDLHRNIRSLIAIKYLKRPYRRVKKPRLKEWFLYFFRRKGYRFFKFKPISRKELSVKTINPNVTFRYELRTALNLPGLPKPIESWVGQFPKGFVCISAESAWPEKQWKFERFFEVGKQIRQLGYGVAWVGLRDLPTKVKHSDMLDLTNKLQIPAVARLFAQARLLICNDSGLMHLAEAVGTPVVSIFGPTSVELGFGPSHPQSRTVESDLWCRPCSKTGRGCFRTTRRYECLSEVSTDLVMKAIHENLGL